METGIFAQCERLIRMIQLMLATYNSCDRGYWTQCTQEHNGILTYSYTDTKGLKMGMLAMTTFN